jgi:DNA-binding CsgD family transcriptional regulator
MQSHEPWERFDEPAPSLDARQVWPKLASGELAICYFATSPTAVYLGVEVVAPADRRAHGPGDCALVEQLLLGAQQKAVASDLGRSAAHVCLRASRCLRALGFKGRVNGVPAALVMLVELSVSGLELTARVTRFDGAGDHGYLVALPRPDRPHALFTPAERAILRGLVDGQHADEIATERGSTVRTVVNQIGSIYRKLRVSGRIELLGKLLRLPPESATVSARPAAPACR